MDHNINVECNTTMNNNGNKRGRIPEAASHRVRQHSDGESRMIPPDVEKNKKKKKGKTVPAEHTSLKDNANGADGGSREVLPLVHCYSTERVVTKRRKKVEARTKSESFGRYSNPDQNSIECDRRGVPSDNSGDDNKDDKREDNDGLSQTTEGGANSLEDKRRGAVNLKHRQEEMPRDDSGNDNRKENEKPSEKRSNLGNIGTLVAENEMVLCIRQGDSVGSIAGSIASFSVPGEEDPNCTWDITPSEGVENGNEDEEEARLGWTLPPEKLTLSDRMHLSFGLCFGHLLQDKSVPNFVFRGMEALKFTLLFYAEKQQQEIGGKGGGDLLSLENISLIAELQWSEAKQNAWVQLFPFDPAFRSAIKKRVDSCVISHRESNMKLGRGEKKGGWLTKPALWKSFRSRIVDGFLIVSIMKLFGFGSVSDVEDLLKEHGDGMSRRTLFEAYAMWASWCGENLLCDLSQVEESCFKSDSETVYGEIMKLIETMPVAATPGLTPLEIALKEKQGTMDWGRKEKFDSDSLYLALLAASGVSNRNSVKVSKKASALVEFPPCMGRADHDSDGGKSIDTTFRLQNDQKVAAVDALLVMRNSVESEEMGNGSGEYGNMSNERDADGSQKEGADFLSLKVLAKSDAAANRDHTEHGEGFGITDYVYNDENAEKGDGDRNKDDQVAGDVVENMDAVDDSVAVRKQLEIAICDGFGSDNGCSSNDSKSQIVGGSAGSTVEGDYDDTKIGDSNCLNGRGVESDMSYSTSTVGSVGANEDSNDSDMSNISSEEGNLATEEVQQSDDGDGSDKKNVDVDGCNDVLPGRRVTRSSSRSMRNVAALAGVVKAVATDKPTTKRKPRSVSRKKSGRKKEASKVTAVDDIKGIEAGGATKGSTGGLIVPLISDQLSQTSYNVCLVAEETHDIDFPPKKVFCMPEQNAKRLMLIELGNSMMMTMADSAKMAHGLLPTDDAFELLNRKTNELSPDGLPLPLSRVVQCSTFLVKGGGNVDGTGPVQVVYADSPVYDKYFGTLRLDLKALIEHLLSSSSNGLRKHSCTFGFQAYNYDCVDRQTILTKPDIKSMAELGEGLRVCTANLLDAMQLCLDEALFPRAKVFNNVVRTDYVRQRISEVEPSLLYSRFEGWTWLLTSPTISLDRHRDKKNCDEEGYAGNCVFSCVYYEATNGLTYRLSLVGFSRKAVGAVLRKLYSYSYDLSNRLNAFMDICGSYNDFAVLEHDRWCWMSPTSGKIEKHGCGVQGRISGVFKESHCGLSSLVTLLRRASDQLFKKIDQQVALLYLACMVGSVGKFWAVVSSWLCKWDGGDTETTTAGAILEFFWRDVDDWGWSETDSGLGVTLGWKNVGDWRCSNEKEGTSRISALKNVLRNAADISFNSNKLLDMAAKTVSGFEHAFVAARLFSLAVLSGIYVNGPFNYRALECDGRKEATHHDVLNEKGCGTMVHQRQFVNAVSKTFDLPKCDSANLIVLGATASYDECEVIVFHGQDLFCITKSGIVKRKEWNSCCWQELEQEYYL